VRLVRLSDGLKQASIARIEQRQRRGAVTDIVKISDKEWHTANWRLGGVKQLVEEPVPLMPRLKRLANLLGVSPRTMRRWVRAYRRDPDILGLLPKPKGPRLGHRRLTAEAERLIREVIDAWVARTEPLPVSWIVEECGRRAKAAGIGTPSRTSIDARVRDRGLDGLNDQQTPPVDSGSVIPTPRSNTALAFVQIDHTLVDVMVVDEIHRQSMGRPWITVAFDIATRAVLGFHLSLHSPSAVSVGLTLAMAGLPKDRWLKDRKLSVDWPMFGIPKLLHLDNGAEFHSLALKRGCERYGISLEYRPPGRPHFGGHIERYLGTLMRRIHGLPGTTFSNPTARGSYRSEARATMTLAELERWITIEIAGRYHQRVNRGVHAVPGQLWSRSMDRRRPELVTDPARFLIDFLPADLRTVGSNGFQINRIRYWDPVLGRVFPPRSRVLVRFNPRDLSKVFVPSPTAPEYLTVPYADLRRPPIRQTELERARMALASKGTTRPTEDEIFASTEAQRRIEEHASAKSRRARRSLAKQPPSLAPPAEPDAKVNYSKRIIPFKGERW
jgi:putative transposase